MSLADQTRWSKTSLREEQALLSAKSSERESGMKAEDWLKALKGNSTILSSRGVAGITPSPPSQSGVGASGERIEILGSAGAGQRHVTGIGARMNPEC